MGKKGSPVLVFNARASKEVADFKASSKKGKHGNKQKWWFGRSMPQMEPKLLPKRHVPLHLCADLGDGARKYQKRPSKNTLTLPLTMPPAKPKSACRADRRCFPTSFWGKAHKVAPMSDSRDPSL